MNATHDTGLRAGTGPKTPVAGKCLCQCLGGLAGPGDSPISPLASGRGLVVTTSASMETGLRDRVPYIPGNTGTLVLLMWAG